MKVCVQDMQDCDSRKLKMKEDLTMLKFYVLIITIE